MSIVLWITMICYISVAMIFNLMSISFYNEEKESFTGNRFADLTALFIGAALWPVATVYGLCKMSKEDDKETK